MARKLKVYAQSMSGGNYTQVPTIILKGQWLKTAGFEAGDYVEVECPACGEIICLDDSILDEDSIQCPACGETLEFEFDCDCDCDED